MTEAVVERLLRESEALKPPLPPGHVKKPQQMWMNILMEGVKGRDLTGSIPLQLKRGEWNHPNLAKLLYQDAAWMADWIEESRLVRRGESSDKLREFANDMALLSAYFVPDIEMSGDAMKYYNWTNTLAFLTDDVTEGNDFGGREIGNAFKITNVPRDIYLGKYPTLESLTNSTAHIYPALAKILYALFMAAEKGRQIIPNFSKDCHYFAKTTSDAFRATIVLELEDHVDEEAERLPDDMFHILRMNDGGEYRMNLNFRTEAFLELAFLCSGPDGVPSVEMRENLYFSRIVFLSTSITSHTNDLFGARRDLHSGLGYSLIVYKEKHMDLQQAFTETVDLITRETMEMMVLCRRLRSQFPGDAHWDKVLRICESYCDGHAFWYLIADRYGDIIITMEEKDEDFKPRHKLMKLKEKVSEIEEVTKIWED